jgi:hypothetical protein
MGLAGRRPPHHLLPVASVTLQGPVPFQEQA